MASAALAAIAVTACGLRTVPRRIRVLAVDGHQLVQEGLAAMINREEDMTVVATASSGQEAIDDVRRYRPDVVTLDLLLPDMSGEDLARQILAEFPRTGLWRSRPLRVTYTRGAPWMPASTDIFRRQCRFGN